MSKADDDQDNLQRKGSATDRQTPNPAVREEIMAFLLTPGSTHRERRSKPSDPKKKGPSERS